MLEGLEITELSFSEVRRESTKLRLDSGYFAKPMLEAEALIRNYPSGYDELGSLFSRFVKGIFDINANSYAEAGVPFLRILNLRNGFIDESNLALIPELIHREEIKTELKRGDIVLSKTAYPAASLVTLDRCNTSQDTIATTLSGYGRSAYTPEAVVAYLNSVIGQRLLSRHFQGNVQLHLSLDDGRKVPIPKFCLKLQEAITATFRKADLAGNAAIHSTRQAETTLLHALGLNNWQTAEPLAYTRSSRDAFAAGRLDAEYFTPRISALRTLLGRDGLCLADVASMRHERFKAEGTGNFDYIEIGGVQADGTAIAETTLLSDAPSRATQHVREGDVVTSTVRPIRRLSALISKEQDGAVCSSGFVVLEPYAIAPETLLTYLRLSPICELMDLHTSASLYPAISEKDLVALPVPSIDANIQASVKSYVRSAQQTRHRAAQFIEAAKRAVEIAIEQDEAAGLAYLAAQNALSPGAQPSPATAGYLQ